MMGLLINVLLFILLLAILVLVAMLFVPVKYLISGKIDDDNQICIRVFWLFKLFKAVICFHNSIKPETVFIVFSHRMKTDEDKLKEKKPTGEKKKKPGKKRKKVHPAQVLNDEMLKSVNVLLSDLLQFFKPKRFVLRGRLGFIDPYRTGMLCCFLCNFDDLMQRSGIDIDAIFDREVFEANLEIEGKLTAAALLWIFIKFALSKQVRAIILSQIRR